MQSGRDQLEEADPQAKARMSGIVVASSGTMLPTNEPYERIPGHVRYPTAEGTTPPPHTSPRDGQRSQHITARRKKTMPGLRPRTRAPRIKGIGSFWDSVLFSAGIVFPERSEVFYYCPLQLLSLHHCPERSEGFFY